MMTKKFLPLAQLLSLALLLAGCGSSPPNNYYLLSAHEFPAASGEKPAVGVGPIEIPAYMNRDNLVYNRVENTLEIANLELWAEPLADGVQRVLVLNLAGLLNTQSVRLFPWHPKRAPDYGVRVDLLQLDASATAAALTAEWLVYRPANSKPVKRRISKLQVPLPTAEPEAVASAYSELLFQLSEIIAAAIATDHTTSQDSPSSSEPS
jgi:uncharacterized lipoprotein YmbA